MYLFSNWELGLSEKILTLTCGKSFDKIVNHNVHKDSNWFLVMAEVITHNDMRIVLAVFFPNCNSKQCNLLLTPVGFLNFILMLTGVIFCKVNLNYCFIWFQIGNALFEKVACFLFITSCSRKEGILSWRELRASSTVPSLATFSLFLQVLLCLV